jgi:ADP-ribose pyrophosphatase YjhB (NUDIX family)
MIFRRGKWDLPKGKLDEGEDIEACALREVTEETGLSDLQLGKKICDTYHIYSQNGEHLLKHTAWYTMQGSSAQKLKPQKAENIMEARWVAQKDLAPLVGKSYEAIREVIRAAGLQW